MDSQSILWRLKTMNRENRGKQQIKQWPPSQQYVIVKSFFSGWLFSLLCASKYKHYCRWCDWFSHIRIFVKPALYTCGPMPCVKHIVIYILSTTQRRDTEEQQQQMNNNAIFITHNSLAIVSPAQSCMYSIIWETKMGIVRIAFNWSYINNDGLCQRQRKAHTQSSVESIWNFFLGYTGRTWPKHSQ